MGDPEAMPCEHCLKAAPAGKRFCSERCLRCEHESESEDGCDEICIHGYVPRSVLEKDPIQ